MSVPFPIDETYVEPNFDVAQLASVEIFSPKVDETLWFFTELLGMSESGRDGDSVYLRAYEDYYHHSLKVTYRNEPGIGRTTWRTSSPQALGRRSSALEANGVAVSWRDGDLGQGPAADFVSPSGHTHSMLWEVDYYEAPESERSRLLSRPQKRPLKGVPVRRLDHVNHLVDDVTANREFLQDNLGFRLRENIVVQQREAAAWMSVSPLVHEIANLADRTGRSAGGNGGLHHLAFWYGFPQHLLDAADMFTDYGLTIDIGPGKHGATQAQFLYVFEPGGNRVELFGDVGYLIFDPAWKPLTWTEKDVDKSLIWYGSPLNREFTLFSDRVAV
ncbi:VOC family protein [Subtercola frigoramans]|uniref:Catechol 2,3-dioxygenase n=1 Tax=Subtercola frigoramans TaxID=120298 RepID=A0ABS2L9E3_9MICO|nr:VOC family protein [Subtercola frigoramans]MBM7473634.1 catechol 2,3-dioxygenase [Subtercola frigoramans]